MCGGGVRGTSPSERRPPPQGERSTDRSSEPACRLNGGGLAKAEDEAVPVRQIAGSKR